MEKALTLRVSACTGNMQRAARGVVESWRKAAARAVKWRAEMEQYRLLMVLVTRAWHVHACRGRVHGEMEGWRHAMPRWPTWRMRTDADVEDWAWWVEGWVHDGATGRETGTPPAGTAGGRLVGMQPRRLYDADLRQVGVLAPNMSAIPARTQARMFLMWVRLGMGAWMWVRRSGRCSVRVRLEGGGVWCTCGRTFGDEGSWDEHVRLGRKRSDAAPVCQGSFAP